ncbi:MAG: ABC transporter ATP-binding protein [Halanaerobiales bacterium]|nr:ABC transporter ATP-binding protein [Halanaerobiales bacterium]
MKENYNKNKPFIKVNDISYSYVKEERIINNLSTSFYKNHFTAIVGSNGSGKTTLGKLLVGIFKTLSGQVLLNGQDTKKMSLGEIGQKVGYLFQEPERQIFAPSVKEEIGFVLDFKGYPGKEIEKKINHMLKLFKLEDLKDDFPFQLSRGEKQRLALASILINEPEFLILDEPTTGLDFKRKGELTTILQELKDQGLGLIVISHDEEFVRENADRVIELSGGEIIGDRSTR